MLERVDAEALLHRFVQAPADVVMAAQVVDEPAVFRQCVELVELVFEQTHVSAGERTPQIHHDRHVVEHVAFRLFRRAEVGGELASGAITTSPFSTTAGQTHSSTMRNIRTMVCTCGRLRQLVPSSFQIRHGVDAEHFDAKIGEAEHAGEHRHEHVRVAVVQIPLERVERR